MLLFVVLSLIRLFYSYSAAAESCTPTSQDASSSPFVLDLADLDHSQGGSFYYVPGRTYTREKQGLMQQQYVRKCVPYFDLQ